MTDLPWKNDLPELREAIAQKLKELRLTSLIGEFKSQYDNPSYEQMFFEQRLFIALQSEALRRAGNRCEDKLKKSMMGTEQKSARLEDITYAPARKINRPLVSLLSTGQWMTREIPANLILCGASGTGKTFMASAFANVACERNLSVLFADADTLLNEIAASHLEGKFQQKIDELVKIKLLVIDDLFTTPITNQNCADLYAIIKQRDRVRPTIITTQYPLIVWTKIMGENVLCNSICDRLFHNSYCIELSGPSMRKKLT